MSTADRIEELELKFSENAKRYFAPLANEYRKAGQLDRAIELCQSFLPSQPGHINGHVVLGQALLQAGRPGEATAVFRTAIALDPENLIALRLLGEIAREGGDLADARRWFQRLLDADPRNDDIVNQLRRVDELTAEHAIAMTTPAVVSTFDTGPAGEPRESGPSGPVSQEREGSAGSAALSRLEGMQEQIAAALSATPSPKLMDRFEDSVDAGALEPRVQETAGTGVAGAEPPVFDGSDADWPDAPAISVEHATSGAFGSAALGTSLAFSGDGESSPQSPHATGSEDAVINESEFLLEVEMAELEALTIREPQGPATLSARWEDIGGSDVAASDPSAQRAEHDARERDAFETLVSEAVGSDGDSTPDESLGAAGNSGPHPSVADAPSVGETGAIHPSVDSESWLALESDVQAMHAGHSTDELGHIGERVSATALPGADEFQPEMDAAAPSWVGGELVVQHDAAAEPVGATGDVERASTTRSASASSAISLPAQAAHPAVPSVMNATPSAGVAAPFVTETMAELYLSQGYTEQALTVYRELAARSPDDARVDQRLWELETSLGLTPSRRSRVVHGADQPAGDTAADPRDEMSVREFLRTFATRRVRPAAPVASPVRPAADALPPRTMDTRPSAPAGLAASLAAVPGDPTDPREGSIDALFGDEPVDASDDDAARRLASAFATETTSAVDLPAERGAARLSAVQSTQPAAQAPAVTRSVELPLLGAPAPMPGRSPTPAAAFSFDRFFTSDAGAREQTAREAEGTPSSASGGASEEDDIEQFNAWLEGLRKR
jgi:hypothetical protein